MTQPQKRDIKEHNQMQQVPSTPDEPSLSGDSLVNLLRTIGDRALAEAVNPSSLNLSAAESLIEEGKAKNLEDALQQIKESMF